MELKWKSFSFSTVTDSSNRTFMELKSRSTQHRFPRKFGSNRTFMELKFSSPSTALAEVSRSNRTFMELK